MDPIFLAVVLSASAGALVFGVLHGAERYKQSSVQELRGLARKLGGRVRSGRSQAMPWMEVPGEPGLLQVKYLGERFQENSQPDTTISVELARHLPALVLSPEGARLRWLERSAGEDLELGEPDFDDAFLVRAEQSEVAHTLLIPEARVALLSILERAASDRVEVSVWRGLEGSSLRVKLGGWIRDAARLEGLVLDVRSAAAALLAGADRPWLAVAERWGLGPLRADGGCRALEGKVEGFAVRLRELNEKGAPRLVVHVSGTSLDDARIVHRDIARREGWDDVRDPLGNPVLDMLVAARVGDIERLRPLFQDQELTASLLEVVHARPGSELTHRGVRLVDSEPTVQGPAEAFASALDLARALRDGLARLERGEE